MSKAAPFSASDRSLVLEIGTAHRLVCNLRRHLSPRTVGIITRSLPLSGRVHRMGQGIVYIRIPVDSGLERVRTDFKEGDVAFLPLAGSICFFLRDMTFPKGMTPIGRLMDDGNGAQLLADAGPGTVLSLRKED